jgi:hypothetical protein
MSNRTEVYSSQDVKRFSDALVDALPDNPTAALNMLAWTYANTIVSTGCDEEAAIHALRKAITKLRGEATLSGLKNANPQ